MNSSMNMVAGAFLGTCFVLMTLSIVSGAIYYSPAPEKEGFPIKAAEANAAGAAQPKKEEIPPIAPLLATADIKKGEQVFKKCEACHDATKGGPNKIGPNLWGVVDRPIASHPGFSYSAALKKFSEDGKKHWTYELLNHWVHSPREVVPGTSMTFPGVKKDQERADVIAYMHSLADNPVPFPKPEAPKAEEGKAAAPAADDKAAAPQGDEAAPATDKATDTKPATDANTQSDKTEAAPDASGAKTDAAGTTEQKPADQDSGQTNEPAAK